MLPLLLAAARSLVLHAATGAGEVGVVCSCALRQAVCAAPPGARKSDLVAWLLQLRAEVATLEVGLAAPAAPVPRSEAGAETCGVAVELEERARDGAGESLRGSSSAL